MTTLQLNPGPLATIPAQVVQGTVENVPWPIDMTNGLPSGGTVSSPSCTFTDVTRQPNVPITLEDDPTVSGNVVTQRIPGSVLTAGHEYELVVIYDAGGGFTLAAVMGLVCPL